MWDGVGTEKKWYGSAQDKLGCRTTLWTIIYEDGYWSDVL